MGGNFQDEDDGEITAINVTPLVDITLVLLIIFMVTTSVITNPEGIGLDKPDAATGSSLEQTKIVVTCRADGSIAVDGQDMADDETLAAALKVKVADAKEPQGIILCDEQARVGKMVHLIDMLRSAGVKKYGIATEKPKPAE